MTMMMMMRTKTAHLRKNKGGMERKQELEWSEAQKIVISRDLVAAAKQQLQFLAVVDRNRHLYDSPALYKAINRCVM